MAEAFIGEIRMFPWTRLPEGFLAANGQLLQISAYKALFSLIGNYYGGDGKTTFMLPNLNYSTPIGASGATGYPWAAQGGAAAYTLTEKQTPIHDHPFCASTATATSTAANNTLLAAVPAASNANIYAAPSNPPVPLFAAAVTVAGAGHAVNNMQPYTVVAFCICVNGFYPPRSS